MLLEVFAQHRGHIALAFAMTHEQNHIRRLDGLLDAFELVGVERCPLAGDVPVVSMAESLAGPPQPMGAQHGMFHICAHQVKDVAVAMVHADHQSVALVSALRLTERFGMLGADSLLHQQLPQSYQRIGV